MRTIAYIDGFNLYHSLSPRTGLSGYKWLDLRKLCELSLPPKHKLIEINYFSTLAHWDAEKIKRHKHYISALETKGITFIPGRFQKVRRRCHGSCQEWYKTHVEKKTDVNMAVHLLEDAVNKQYEKALILTADSDIVPAVHALKRVRPELVIEALIPPNLPAKEIRAAVKKASQVKEQQLASSQLDNPVIKDRKELPCPPAWQEKPK